MFHARGDRLASFPGFIEEGYPENETTRRLARSHGSATWLLRLHMRTTLENGVQLQGSCWSVLFFLDELSYMYKRSVVPWTCVLKKNAALSQ